MNPNLNPMLFDSVIEGLAQHGPEQPAADPRTPRYMQTIPQEANPLYSDAGTDLIRRTLDNRRLMQPTPKEEFVPSYELQSEQETVNPYAVNHMTQHATGLDVPNINVAREHGEMAVYDGNHTVNAALKRGQMLVPANVYDY